MTDKAPYQTIQRYVNERAGLSDAAVLDELAAMQPLRDEADPVWDTDEYWMNEAYRYVALGDLVAERKLRDGVKLLLERACFGDPGEIMRGLRHSSEAAFNPDWEGLRDVCIPLAKSVRAGTRLWAIEQLTVLDDPIAEVTFRQAIVDMEVDIRAIAKIGLERLGVLDI